mgnify:FL=1
MSRYPHMKNITLSAVLGVAVIIGVVLFTTYNTPQDDPIKIGVVYGLTGPASSWTDYGIKAAELAVSEINENGGVNGRLVELVIEDSNSSPAKAVAAYQKLTDIDKVGAVIGDVW